MVSLRPDAFCLVFFFMMLLAAVLSFFIDPEEVYFKRYLADKKAEKFVEELLVSEHGVVASRAERIIKFKLAKLSNAECFVLGSSRSMQASLRGEGWITDSCGSLANLGVSGGTLEDVVIYSSLMGEKGSSKIYLVIDPWMLKHGSDVRWMEYESKYKEFLQELGLDEVSGESFWYKKLTNLFNYEYVLASYDLLVEKGWSALPDFGKESTTNVPAFDWQHGYSAAVTLSDGSHVYSESYINKSNDEVVVGDGYRNYKEGHVVAQEKAVELFVTLLERLNEKHDVSLLLTPFHPNIYSEKNSDYVERIDAIEKRIKSIGHASGIEVLGSYNPFEVGCEKDVFFDAIHPKFTCLNMFSK